VGLRAVLNAVVKRKIPSPCRKSNPRTPIVHMFIYIYPVAAINAYDSWGRFLLEKLTVANFVKKFPSSYAISIFITVFTISHRFALSLTNWVQFTPHILVL